MLSCVNRCVTLTCVCDSGEHHVTSDKGDGFNSSVTTLSGSVLSSAVRVQRCLGLGPTHRSVRQKRSKTRMWANAQRDGHPAFVQRRKVSLTPTTTVPCSNAAKKRNPLKSAEVCQTNERISAASRRSSPYCRNMWGTYCCLTSFFLDCRYVPSLRRYSPTKLCDGAQTTNVW